MNWLNEGKTNINIMHCMYNINPLKTKGRPLYLKIQFVPRCKYFSSRL